MFWWFCTCVGVTFLLVPTNCIFAGDSCQDNDREGTCQLLSTCKPLLAEIRQAGRPIPSWLRNRLRELACGFELDQPLVCCAQESTGGSHSNGFANTETVVTSNQNWGTPNTNRPSWTERPRTSTTQRATWNTNPWTSPTQPWNSSPERPGDENKNGGVDGPVDVRRHRNIRLLNTNCGEVNSDRIYGGNRTHLLEMPWMVLIAYNSPRGTKLSCAGSLITRRYVLTAAHCVSFLGSRMSLSGVVLGEHDVRRDPDCERQDGLLQCAPGIRNVSIESVTAHPGYSPQNLYDDIALIRLTEPADFSMDNIKPICLPTTTALQSEPLEGLKGVVAGWGATEDGLQSPVLLSVDLPILSNEECRNIYNGNPEIYARQLCAGGVQNKDSCGGDSGGPLMYIGRVEGRGVRYVQRGIVSFGSKRCGVGGYPGVYTRVSHYMQWILDNIRD